MAVELLDQPGSTAEACQTSPLLLLLLLLLLLHHWHAVARRVDVCMLVNIGDIAGTASPHCRSGLGHGIRALWCLMV
jgi:hypothetical protein